MAASSFDATLAKEIALRDQALLALIDWAPRLVEQAAQGPAHLAASRGLATLESIHAQIQQTDAQELEKLFAKAIEIKKSNHKQFKKFFSKLKHTQTLGDGACMFNGFILALRQPHVLNALDHRAEAGHLNLFIEMMGEQFKIEKNWQAVKKQLQNKDARSVQAEVAPLLRRITVDVLRRKIERADLHDPKALDLDLLCAFDAYWNQQGDPSSSLYTEKSINIDVGNQLLRKQFDKLLGAIEATRGPGHSERDAKTRGKRYLASEALLAWWHDNDEANQLAYLNEERAAEHDERLCWAFERYAMECFKEHPPNKKLFEQYCRDKEIEENKFDNFDDTYKKYDFIEAEFAVLSVEVASEWVDHKKPDENFAKATEKLLAWWHENNHQPYFQFLDAMAQQSAYGGELEVRTLAQYFGVSVIIYAPRVNIESPNCVNEDPADPTRPWIALRHEGWVHWTTYLGPCFLVDLQHRHTTISAATAAVAKPAATAAATGSIPSPPPGSFVSTAHSSSVLSRRSSPTESEDGTEQTPEGSFVALPQGDATSPSAGSGADSPPNEAKPSAASAVASQPAVVPPVADLLLGDASQAIVPAVPAAPKPPRQNKMVRWAAAGGITTSGTAVGVGIGLALIFAVGCPWLVLPIIAAIGLGVGIAAAVIYWHSTREQSSGGAAAASPSGHSPTAGSSSGSSSTHLINSALPQPLQPNKAAPSSPAAPPPLTAASARLYPPRRFAVLTAGDPAEQDLQASSAPSKIVSTV
jgi:hypothetical protein